jgi:hypothetical protein
VIENQRTNIQLMIFYAVESRADIRGFTYFYESGGVASAGAKLLEAGQICCR